MKRRRRHRYEASADIKNARARRMPRHRRHARALQELRRYLSALSICNRRIGNVARSATSDNLPFSMKHARHRHFIRSAAYQRRSFRRIVIAAICDLYEGRQHVAMARRCRLSDSTGRRLAVRRPTARRHSPQETSTATLMMTCPSDQ